MHYDTPAPRVPDTSAEHITDTHAQRTRSFNIEDFNDLVSTALDMQRLPDSSLAFSLNATTNTRPLRTPQGSTDITQRSKVLRTFKDALKRKGVAENASERGSATRHLQLTRLSGTHHIASSSVPALPPTINHSAQIPYSPSLTNVDEYDSDGSATDPLSSTPATPATSSPFGLYRAFPRDPWLQQESSTSDTTQQSSVPQERARTKSTHKNFFMSLPFTKLKRKSSRLLFSSGSPPSPIVLGDASNDTSVAESDHSHSECDGMRSFFDDSGFEEAELSSFKPVRKAKSRPGIRHFFSAPSTVFDSALVQATQDVQYRATKPLPPTPARSIAEFVAKDEALIQSRSAPRSLNAKFQIVQHEYASPFYAPPSLPHRPAPQPLKVLPGKDQTRSVNLRHLNVHERSPFERLSRSMDLVRVPVRIRSRYSPSPYPSPTSPLPPPPAALSSQLMSAPPMNPLGSDGLDQESSEDMSCESADQSIDSIEILSWRTRGLKKRSSKTSSGSAHARGMPSRNSIRERFGLGPQLHIHVSGSETEQPKTIDHGDLQDPYIRTRTTSTHTLRPTSRVNTSMEVSTVRTLTSMPIQSLRESLYGYEQTSCSDTGCHFETFALEEDPFAPDPLSTPPTIPTPPSPQSSAQSMKLRSIMPLGNDSKPVSISAPDTPNLWNSFLRLRQSSPSLSTSTVTASPGKPTYSPYTSFASPSSVHSGLPPSLVDALGARDNTPSPSGSPRRSNLSVSLNQLLLRTKGAQRHRKDSAVSKLTYVSEGSSGGGSPGITGHSDSRPHSPFPLLFFRSGASKPSPVTKETYLEGNSSETSTRTAAKHSEEPEAHTPTSSAFRVRKLQPISAQDADAFGDACKRYSEFSLGSPLGISASVASSGEIKDGLPFNESEVINGLCLTLNSTEESSPPLLNGDDNGTNGDIDRIKNGDLDTVADNEELRASKQVWPLPPLRTVVLDEVNGEGWHDVDQTIEHIPLYATIPDVPRHTIRLPTTCRSGSHRSSSSKGSSSGSSKSRKLDAQQARKIIETINNQTLDRQKSPSPLTNVLERLSTTSHRRSLSLDSDFSFLSSDTGSQSIKTCGSAYYSIRSSYSVRSKKSSSKSAALRRAMVPSNNNPIVLTTPERSGSVRRTKSPCFSTFSQDGVASYDKSAKYSSTAVIKVAVANESLDTTALPCRISLCDESMATTMTITADGWTELMRFCSQHENICIEAGKENAMLWISIEEVAIKATDNTDFFIPSIPGGLPISSIHVLMTLSLNTPKHEELTRDTSKYTRNPDLTFCLPLPATLGEIAEHSRRSSVGEGFTGLTL